MEWFQQFTSFFNFLRPVLDIAILAFLIYNTYDLLKILGEDVEVYVDLGRFNEPGTCTVPVCWRKKGAAYGLRPLQITVAPREINISPRRTWEAYP